PPWGVEPAGLWLVRPVFPRRVAALQDQEQGVHSRAPHPVLELEELLAQLVDPLLGVLLRVAVRRLLGDVRQLDLPGLVESMEFHRGRVSRRLRCVKPRPHPGATAGSPRPTGGRPPRKCSSCRRRSASAPCPSRPFPRASRCRRAGRARSPRGSTGHPAPGSLPVARSAPTPG